MNRTNFVETLREKVGSQPWLTIFLIGYVISALLFRSSGWGIPTGQSEQRIIFVEDWLQGDLQRLEVQARVPERLFMPLPWLDSPPLQTVTFDFVAINLQRPYTLTARLAPSWLWQVVDSNGTPVSLRWTFGPGAKRPDSLTVYLKPIGGIQNWTRLQLELILEPPMENRGKPIEKRTMEFVIESKFRAFFRRFLLVCLGGLTIFLSIFAILLNAFWQYFQQIQRQYQEKIQKIIIDNDLLNATENIIQINKNKLNVTNRLLYKEAINRIQTMPWELAFLRVIDKFILTNDIFNIEKLLNELAKFQEIQQNPGPYPGLAPGTRPDCRRGSVPTGTGRRRRGRFSDGGCGPRRTLSPPGRGRRGCR